VLNFVSHYVEESLQLGERLARFLPVGGILHFKGEMGAGKTHIIQGLLRARGIAEADISSPTFTIAHYYQTRRERLVHYDLYRLEDLEDFGLMEDYLSEQTTVLVEWPEKLKMEIPALTEVIISKSAETERKIEINFRGYTMTEANLKALYEKYQPSEKIVLHMQKVAELSAQIAEKLLKRGEIVNLELLKQGALLHDLVKYIEWPNQESDPLIWQELRQKHFGQKHSVLMANLLRKYHYPDLANLVGDHDSWDFGKWRTWEEKILRYADAHVEGDKIVSLEQRIVNAKPKYPGPHSQQFWQEFASHQKKLAAELGLSS